MGLRNQTSVEIVKSLANIRVFPLYLETALLAIFTIQTSYFVYHECRIAAKSTLRRTYRRGMLCLATFLYLLAVVYWTLDIVILRQELLVFVPGQMSLTQRPDVVVVLPELVGMYWYARATMQLMIWTISDCVALWRAYAVLGRPGWLNIVIPLIFVCAIGAHVCFIVLYLQVLPDPPRFVLILWESESALVVIASFLAVSSVTVAIQTFSTSLIAYKACVIYRERQGLFRGPGRAFRILAVLIESGIGYMLLWIWFIVGKNGDVFNLAQSVWPDYCIMMLTAMYPTLVVMLVTVRDSVLVSADNLPLSRPGHFETRELGGAASSTP
ncbi:unnamed protein product [Peniophora sp. CBMAI 1063]|nr:unnamed protein product [Peniophora sp. CBMAI 1063]